jgi:carboxymethylenebutenolidase
MSGSDVTINSNDGGQFSGYLALPESGTGPGVVVIQEIFGVNDVMRGITDEWAANGYVALCPDIFWRQEPGIQLTDQTEEDWARAFELFNGFDLDMGVDDLSASIEMLRRMPECTGKVGTVGFCLGGRLAFLTATRADPDAAIGYYGVMLQEHTDETLRAPVMLHIATEDGFVPKDAQEAVHAALDGNAKAILHDYEGNDHAFARKGGEHYDAAAEKLASERSQAFFKQYLG